MSRRPLDKDNASHMDMKEFMNMMIFDPSIVDKIEFAEINSRIKEYLDAIHRFRMGGRSTPLISLCLLLWYAHNHGADLEINVEECLTKAIDICRDPSYVQPEWGVVLTGVIVAHYVSLLPVKDGNDNPREEIEKQCRMMLRDLDQRGVTQPVRQAAGALLNAWDAGFPHGLTPVVKAGLNAWPDTTDVKDLDLKAIQSYLGPLSSQIVTCDMTQRERTLYHAMCELDGKWELLQNIKLE